MAFDYFYGQQAEQFTFYRIPKILFTDRRFSGISTDAKTLYGILLDRMNLSAKNGWLDKYGRVYIIFTLEEVMAALNCADQKATKLFQELEYKCGLIERKRQGMGKPNLIYVKNFIDMAKDTDGQKEKSRLLIRDNHDSGTVKNTIQDSPKSQGNNTDLIKTDNSNTDSFLSFSTEEDMLSKVPGHDKEEIISMRKREKREEIRDYFLDRLGYKELLNEYPYETAMLEEIFELLVDTCCTSRSIVRIAGDDKPAEVVKSRLMKLDKEHIGFVMDCLKENTTRVRNMKQYLLAALYNAPLTMNHYYASLVRHDKAEGLV